MMIILFVLLVNTLFIIVVGYCYCVPIFGFYDDDGVVVNDDAGIYIMYCIVGRKQCSSPSLA